LAAVDQGESKADVARILNVTVRSINRWDKTRREQGVRALRAKPQPGRKPYLNAAQCRQVLGWIEKNPRDLGFPTELWTAGRVARMIQQRFHIHYNSHYLSQWLSVHGVTPQKPRRVPREKNLDLIEAWLRTVWPVIKKPQGASVHGS
jgi:transposase